MQEGFHEERRGLFDGLRVPHSFNAVLVAAIGLLVYVLGVWAFEELAEVPPQGGSMCRLLGGMLGNLTSHLGPLGAAIADLGGWRNEWTPYKPIVWISFVVWTTAVWALFAGGIHRIAAMQIAREDGLELREALRFGVKKFAANFFSVVLVWGILGAFALLINATLAGWIGRIPYLGDVLLGVFFFLVVITSLVIVLVSVLGLLGFNLAAAAIATEDSDTFDGISRAWNYLLARPWTVLLTYVAIFLYLGVVLFAGGFLTRISIKSLSAGWWGLGVEARTPVKLDQATKSALELGDGLSVIYLPGKGEYLYNRVLGHKYDPDELGRVYFRQGVEFALERFKRDMGRYPKTSEGLGALIRNPARGQADPPPELENWTEGHYLEGLQSLPLDRHDQNYVYRFPGKLGQHYDLYSTGPDRIDGTPDDRHGVQGIALGYGPALDIAPVQEWTLTTFAARGVGFWVNLARLLLSSYVIAYFLCAQTTVYFLLRRDVEGDDYTEITMENEDEADLEQPYEYPSFQDAGTVRNDEPPKNGSGDSGNDGESDKDDDPNA